MKAFSQISLVITILLALLIPENLNAQNYKGNKEYLKFAEKSANWTYENKDSIIDLWKEKFDPNSIFGYRPPSRLLETATIYAHLYEIKKKKVYVILLVHIVAKRN